MYRMCRRYNRRGADRADCARDFGRDDGELRDKSSCFVRLRFGSVFRFDAIKVSLHELDGGAGEGRYRKPPSLGQAVAFPGS